MRWPLATLALLPLHCGPGPQPPSLPARPPIVLLLLDTLRADRLGCYGYHRRPVSPALDRFAATATRYTRAQATSPWTLPSHASLFTGLYPFEHGAHTIRIDLAAAAGSGEGRELADNVRPLGAGPPTLAETLARAGYATAAFAANDIFLKPGYGLARGFATYEVGHAYAPEMNRRAEAWLDANTGAGRAPFFLFVNYMDTHVPYNPAPRPGLLDRPVPDDSRPVMDLLYATVLPAREPAPRELLDVLAAQYDRGIANLDQALGELFAALDRRGLWDPALVIVTSDHGEYLGEHALVAHSKDVYEGALHIPLLVKLPGQRSGRIEQRRISLAHLPRLILARVAGADAAPYPYDEHDAPLLAESYYSRLKDLRQPWGRRFDRVRQVLYRDDWKLIRSSDARHELYDLAGDPGETRNLFAQREPLARALGEELKRGLAARRAAPAGIDPRLLSEEEKERLRALGYL